MTDNERAPVSETPATVTGATEKKPRPRRTTQARTARSARTAKTAKRAPTTRTRSTAKVAAEPQAPENDKISLADFMATVSSSDAEQEKPFLAQDADQDTVLSGASFFESIANKTLFTSDKKDEETASPAADTGAAGETAESQAATPHPLENQVVEDTADEISGQGTKARATRPAAKRGRPRKKPQAAVGEIASVAPAPEKIEEQAPKPVSRLLQKKSRNRPQGRHRKARSSKMPGASGLS